MKEDMEERKKILEMKVRSNLLNYPLSASLYSDNPYYHLDSIQDLREVLLEDKFLYLIPDELIWKIHNYTQNTVFLASKTHKEEEIKSAGVAIRQKIRRIVKTNQVTKSLMIEKAIEEEKRIRNIPDDFLIELEDVIKFYSLDFKNREAIVFPTGTDEDIPKDLFCFLATVNKLCKECPSTINEREEFIKLIIEKINYCDPKYAPIVEKYYQSTLELLVKAQKLREKEHRIIEFGKVLSK